MTQPDKEWQLLFCRTAQNARLISKSLLSRNCQVWLLSLWQRHEMSWWWMWCPSAPFIASHVWLLVKVRKIETEALNVTCVGISIISNRCVSSRLPGNILSSEANLTVTKSQRPVRRRPKKTFSQKLMLWKSVKTLQNDSQHLESLGEAHDYLIILLNINIKFTWMGFPNCWEYSHFAFRTHFHAV